MTDDFQPGDLVRSLICVPDLLGLVIGVRLRHNHWIKVVWLTTDSPLAGPPRWIPTSSVDSYLKVPRDC